MSVFILFLIHLTYVTAADSTCYDNPDLGDCLKCNGKVFGKDGQCYDSCDSTNEIPFDYRPRRGFQRCVTNCDKLHKYFNESGDLCVDCQSGKYLSTSDGTCNFDCKNGEIKDPITRTCLTAKENCEYFISRNGKVCEKKCQPQEYPVLIKGVAECRFCFGFILKSQTSTEFDQCVDKCPDSMIIYKNKEYEQSCMTPKECGDKYFPVSADKSYCSNYCIPPEAYLPDVGCVESCPQLEQQIENRKDLVMSLHCVNSCSSLQYTYGSKCLNHCKEKHLVLGGTGTSKFCYQCSSNQYINYNFEAGVLQCENRNFNKTKDTLQRIQSLKQATSFYPYIFEEPSSTFVPEELIKIMTQLYEINLFKENLSDLAQQVSFFNLMLQGKYRYKPYLIQSPKVTIQTKWRNYNEQFVTTFSYQGFRNNSDLSYVANDQRIGLYDKFNPHRLILLFSEFNYLCVGSAYPEECVESSPLFQVLYRYLEMIEVKPLEQTFIYDADLDGKDLTKFVCVTTNEKGRMQRSINTEILSNPPSIKCTFLDNVTPFYDLECLFPNPNECCPSKPYTSFEGKCYAQCPELFDPIEKRCVRQLHDCTLMFEGHKECLSECHFTYPYKSKPDFESQNPNRMICRKSCRAGEIADENKKECLSNSNNCNDFLIDNKLCSTECPSNKYQYKGVQQTTSYRLCNTTCEFIINDFPGQKECSFGCDSFFATVNELNQPIQKYCNGCPKSHPLGQKINDKLTACFDKCSNNQILDKSTNTCLKSKEECKGYLVFDQDQNNQPKEINEKTKFHACQPQCDAFSIKWNSLNICMNSCLDKQLVDLENKKCYSEKQQCPLFVTVDGQQCSSECGDKNQNQLQSYFVQAIGSYKQCLVCNDILKEEVVDPSTKKPYYKQCVKECDQDEMVYLSNQKNNIIFKQCVPKEFCSKSNKKVSYFNPQVCSDNCLGQEVQYNDKCSKVCPDGYLLSLQQRHCLKECKTLTSSDGNVCLEQCEALFEILEEPKGIKNERKCKQCGNNEYLSLQTEGEQIIKGTCNQILEQSEQTLQTIKSDITQWLNKSSIKTTQEQEAAERAIRSYETAVGNILKSTQNKKDLKEKEKQNIAKSSLISVLELIEQYFKNTDQSLLSKPSILGNDELLITSQVAHPGQQYKASFDFIDIKEGNIYSLIENENKVNLSHNNTLEVPSILFVSYIKNNYFCSGDNCQDYSPLVNVQLKKSLENQRKLSENVSELYDISYIIQSDQSASKFLCVSYDQEGNMTQNQGKVENKNQIVCSFSYSVALFYDQKCNFVNKEEFCQAKEEEEGGMNIMLLIGIIILVTLLIAGVLILFYVLRRRYLKKKQSESYEEFDQSTNIKSTNQINSQ